MVRRLGLTVLQENLAPLLGGSEGSGSEFTPQDILNALLYAATNRTSIEGAATQLATGPHPNTVRLRIAKLELAELETQINAGLRSRLPPKFLNTPRKIAIDLTFIPYYGQATEENQEFIIRGEAKAGTTRFFAYATLYIIQENKRFTLALRCVRQDDTLLDLVRELLEQFWEMGGQVQRLYLDRGFYQVIIVRYLKREGLSFVLLAPANKGIKKLFCGRESYRTEYVMTSSQDGKEPVEILVTCQYSMGKHGRHRVEWSAYVVNDYDRPLRTVAGEYRRRFGVESSYSSMNEARGRTSSRDPLLRLLFVGLALLLVNLWIFLKWMYVSWPRKGGRRVFGKRFPFRRLLTFLSREMEGIYGLVQEIWIPPPGQLSRERRSL